jgi:hypothetical protein
MERRLIGLKLGKAEVAKQSSLFTTMGRLFKREKNDKKP